MPTDFLQKLKPKVVGSGRLRALEADADVFLKLEIDDISIFTSEEEGVVHIVSQNEKRLIVVRLTERF